MLAAQQAGRDASEITLVGVTKTQDAPAVRALLQAGVLEIGENRVQELLAKEPELSDLPHKTHLIGHLQRNKVKYLPGHIDMLQSLDSIPLAQELEKVYAAHGTRLDVLIEVNIGKEASKAGVPPGQLGELVDFVASCPSLCLRGLMAIPPQAQEGLLHGYFQQMHQLFIDIKTKKSDNKIINILSMGMTHDYRTAILEGATMVRVGTALFGPRI